MIRVLTGIRTRGKVFSERVPLDSDIWQIVRKHGVGLEHLDIYWRVREGIHYLELRWKKHIFKEIRDAIASDLRAQGYNVRLTGILSNPVKTIPM